jgi:RNA polymerase-binding transcription factor DksA
MKTTDDKEKVRYSEIELKEFEELLMQKLRKSKDELAQLKESITRKATGEDSNIGSLKSLEDGADSQEKEQLNQLAARTQKYISQLESALIRIKNGTYGICIDTGKLISKERLRAVPHTQHSIEAKLSKQK